MGQTVLFEVEQVQLLELVDESLEDDVWFDHLLVVPVGHMLLVCRNERCQCVVHIKHKLTQHLSYMYSPLNISLCFRYEIIRSVLVGKCYCNSYRLFDMRYILYIF